MAGGKMMKIRMWVGAVGLGLALVVGAVAGSLITAKNQGLPLYTARVVPLYIATHEARGEGHAPLPMTFAPIVKPAMAAVVNISSSKMVRTPGAGPWAPLFNDPFFRQFFGDRFPFSIPRERREQSLGSGVIVSPEGYILTNNHVVEGATDIKVVLDDNRELKARIVGTDPKTDVAVLKVDAGNLPTLTLGDSSKVQVGDLVFAIGNPFGLSRTVTMGIVSATGRGNLGIEDYEDFIQTDAPINPGNSGGALINARGELIGINTAILSSGAQGNQGIGFAIPINMARQVMEQILRHGKVIRGYLGVTIQPVTPAIAKAFGLPQARGALVADVRPDSPAARSGLSRGDIILELSGQPIHESRELQLKIAQMAPGTTVRLKIFRNGQEREVSVRLDELPSQPPSRNNQDNEPSSALDGISVDELTPQVARQLGLSASMRGVVIVDVEPGSAAADAGLQRGDVIQEVNRQPVTSVREFERAVEQAGKNSVLLLVNRGGNTFYVVVEPY
ncbi:MAG: DegQ family serine endoprotease [Blastocatellia bacterium]|nr:DegQ family serine endoprotease [Blastocatellia bacterium]MCS7157063.1 DegQ family serine endoprotease [Blastocatellia bacterium]MCX7752264.1 DegQ family serine endoprotease [Blastocatellia bacterium]MDW8167756.1 DegQ family serine endoprotease [Acidobacteriota bacterium]MDW8256776.1 DegQ family serine endoprotease [Acidobacteriota bacterium]